MTKRRIFDESPRSWKELQSRVAQVFSELGCDVTLEKTVHLPRGSVALDIVVRDKSTAPHSLYVCECKHWSKRVPKSVVHGFRTVVSELGANRGFLIAGNGFQVGSIEAAEFTNIDLLTWRQFEELMFDRWLAAITRKLHRFFHRVAPLMDPTDESLWKLRECTEESYEEWQSICRRYQLITVWTVCHELCSVGLPAIPRLGLTVDTMNSSGSTPLVLNTYRRVVDAAPGVCRAAYSELSRFWGLNHGHEGRKKSRSYKRLQPSAAG